MLVNNMLLPLMSETVWFDKYKYDEAERLYEERNAKKLDDTSNTTTTSSAPSTGSIAEEIAKTRERIQNSLKNVNVKADTDVLSALNQRVQKLEVENKEILSMYKEVQSTVKSLMQRMQHVERALNLQDSTTISTTEKCAQTQKAAEVKGATGDDDDVDLFGSDEEEDEAVSKVREERLKAYETKKAKKAPLVAKSSVVLDVKPWDDETDLKEMESKVREVQTDGLVWGASKFVPLAYGIKKLQIVAIVEDEKVSIDWLQETIQEIEELVQSVDVAAFNKL